jgi:hypothetical protein
MPKIVHNSVGIHVADESSREPGALMVDVTLLDDNGGRNSVTRPLADLLTKPEAAAFAVLYEKIKAKAAK